MFLQNADKGTFLSEIRRTGPNPAEKRPLAGDVFREGGIFIGIENSPDAEKSLGPPMDREGPWYAVPRDIPSRIYRVINPA